MVDAVIPLLYPANERSFLSHGLGPIPDATSCTVTEDLDGRYELELTLPATSARVADLTDRAIILAKPNPYDALQPFRIYKISKQSSLQVTLRAQHISYDLNGYPVWPMTAVGAANAVNSIDGQPTHASLHNPFVLHTTCTDTATTFTVSVPTPERTVIGGANGSLRSVFGGELRYDAFDVYHVDRRGSDRGCVLAYRKSILELRQERSVEELYTAVVPYYYDSETGAYAGNPQPVIAGADWVNYKPVDVSEHFSERPANDVDIDAWGAKWAAENLKPWPELSFQVNTVPPGSVGLDGLESLQLGDTVGVRYEILGIAQTANSGENAKKRVTSYSYDVLRARYTSLQIGDREPTAAEVLSDAGRLTRGTIAAGRFGAGSISGSALVNKSVGGRKIPDAAIAYAQLNPDVQTTFADMFVAQSVFSNYVNVNGYLTTRYIIVNGIQCEPQDMYITNGAGQAITVPGVLREMNGGN